MGAQGSKLRSLIPTTEGVAYATRRKHAAKELLAADEALRDAAAAYAEALKGAGSSLVAFCAGTSLYAGTALGGEAPAGSASQSASHAVPQSGPLLPSSGGSAEGEHPDGMPPALSGEQQMAGQGSQEGGLTPQDRAFFSANDIPLPPSQTSEAPGSSALPEPDANSRIMQPPVPAPGGSPGTAEQGSARHPPEAKPGWVAEPASQEHMSTQLSASQDHMSTKLSASQEHMSTQLSAASSGSGWGDKALDQYAKQLSDLFLEAAALTGPLIEALGPGAPLGKDATPPLAASNARGLDGRLEPLGQSLQKLANWERKLKVDIKVVDACQHELRKKDKRLDMQARKVLKKRTVDTRVMDTARNIVNEVTARLAASTASLESTLNELERFKSDLMLQQVLRLLPMFASLWQLSAAIFSKQQQLALQLSMQAPPQVTRSGSLSLAFHATDVSGPLTPVPEASAAANSGAGAGVPASGPLPRPQGQGQGQEGGGALVRSQSAFARAIGVAFSGTTKAQHEATKKLEDAFKRLNTANSALSNAQRGFCTSLMMWASKTKAIPSSFPKPAPLALPPAQQQPPLQLPLQQQQQMQFQPQQQQQQQMPQMQFQQQQQQQMPQMQTQMQQQMQMQQQQQMQLMVHKGDIFTALPSDWMRMLDTLPDGELQGAISGFCGWLHQAYNLQNQEMKASKRLLEATRLLDKVEQKLAEKKQREHELRLVLAKSGELMAGHEKEYHVKEQQLLAASNDVASAKAMVEAARDRDAKERIGMERLIAGGKVAVAAALQRRLAVVFQQAGNYATTASRGFSSLQTQHAPWMSGPPSEPTPNVNTAQAPSPGTMPSMNPAQAA